PSPYAEPRSGEMEGILGNPHGWNHIARPARSGGAAAGAGSAQMVAVPDRVFRQRVAAGQAELLRDRRPVVLHRSVVDPQDLGDLLARLEVCDQAEDADLG